MNIDDGTMGSRTKENLSVQPIESRGWKKYQLVEKKKNNPPTKGGNPKKEPAQKSSKKRKKTGRKGGGKMS